MTTSSRHLRYLIIACIIGNTLEWYEFVLYVQFVPLFSKIFFPTTSDLSSMILTLFVFATGFVARPFGALLFGNLGDRKGRKKALMMTILLMTIPTFLFGLMPTFSQIGILAAVLVGVIRFAQGIPIGGEFSGIMSLLIESAPREKRGFVGSWVFFGSQLGCILSIAEVLILDEFLPPADLSSWGWRLSFFMGGLLGWSGWLLRKKMLESPLFESIKREGKVAHQPILESILHHKEAMLRAFFLTLLPVLGWYLVFVFSPLYFSELLGIDLKHNLILNLAMLAFSNLLLPCIGKFADRRNKESLLVGSAIALIILSYPFFYLVINHAYIAFIIMELVAVTLLSLHFALLPQVLCELFPTRVRYTCVGLSYNSCNMIFGGGSPFFALYLVELTGNPLVPAFLLMAAALIYVLAFVIHRDKPLEL